MSYKQAIQSFLDGDLQLHEAQPHILQSINNIRQRNQYFQKILDQSPIHDEASLDIFFKAQKKSIKDALKHFKVLERIVEKINKLNLTSNTKISQIITNSINKQMRRFKKLIPDDIIENLYNMKVRDSFASSIIVNQQETNKQTGKQQVIDIKNKEIGSQSNKIQDKQDKQDKQEKQCNNQIQQQLFLIQKLNQFSKSRTCQIQQTQSQIQEKQQIGTNNRQKASIIKDSIIQSIKQSRQKGIKQYYTNIIMKYKTKQGSTPKTIIKTVLLCIFIAFILFVVISVYAVYRLIKAIQGQL